MHTVAEFKPVICSLALWRAVEAMHRVATMVLVDTLDEQFALERELEKSKPPLADQLTHLHWLLFTPFRYPPLPTGSRFRGPGDPGVFYGAESQRTACAELGYWRWRFLMDCPDLVSIDPMPQTLFQAEVTGAAIDLRGPEWAIGRARWMHPTNYAPCQEVAERARRSGIQVIRYASVRDQAGGACAAVLDPAALSKHAPIALEGWTLSVSKERVFWKSGSVFEDKSFDFKTDGWRC